MKLDALATLALLAALPACVEQPLPLRAASMTHQPAMLPSTSERCSAETLASAAPWAGQIVTRTLTTVPATNQVVFERVARCERLDAEACHGWAREQLRQVAITTNDPIERRVETGIELRGTMWSLLVDGEREGHLLRTNRDFARLLRRLASAGHSVEVTDRQRVREPRFGRVHMKVVATGERVAPAERWTIEFEDSELAVVEVGLALDDLEKAGLRLSDRDDFDSRARKITPIATTAYLATPLRDSSSGREQATVVVSCGDEGVERR